MSFDGSDEPSVGFLSIHRGNSSTLQSHGRIWGMIRMGHHSVRLVEPRILHQVPMRNASIRPEARRVRKSVRVLAVESDSEVAKGLVRDLWRHGFQAESVSTGAQALHQYRNADLLLVDLDLPDLDGVELCRNIRAVCDVPIIVVTARDSELDRVMSLRAGSDDYVPKPYSLAELIARIEAVMRRALRQPASPDEVVAVGPLSIDPRAREIRLDGRTIEVTRKEFDLLYLLASRPGMVVTREQIMVQVWRDSRSVPGRTIDTHVSSLRSKLGSSDWIVTARGVGFRLGRA
ncbi:MULTISPECIES: response regulator transcription factor [unclassified Streptomyces]|uniref:response regulator transcription factor n=1 Tax=unclassified Streptomyces TaxID=2593676 RepID=UPI002040A065|nr:MULTISPECIES: response regulator transcription factor [unclassified Streptomyces]MDU0303538.1 response regulator transcription factor [Streptomyces sp. PAL114]